jgi:hypothetical protein
MLLKVPTKLGFILLRVEFSASSVRVFVVARLVIEASSVIVVLRPLLGIRVLVELLIGHLHLLGVELILEVEV